MERPNSFNLHMQTLHLGGIHSAIQFANRGLTSTPLQPEQTLLVQAGREEFPHIGQLYSVRTTTLSRRDVNNI